MPDPVDPRLFAAELEDAVSEFNRLANLAAQQGLAVEAEVRTERTPDFGPDRVILSMRMAVGR